METTLGTITDDRIKQEQKNLAEISTLSMLNIGIVLDNKYEIIREIGRGGMGIVYEAYHKYTHKRVAIKVILADEVDPVDFKRFQKELEAYSLLSHPNVIMIHDAGVYSTHYAYIVMEYIEGVDICTYIKQQEEKNKRAEIKTANGEQQGKDWKLCARLIYETALGLDYIHSQKMIHRDIKPANIIIRPNGSPVIIDLGLVKFNRTRSYNLTKNKEIVGTIEYMPIEQAQGKKGQIDARTDVYSLGLVLYELLTGQKAYSGENLMELCYKVMFSYPLLPREIDPQIPEVLEKITIHATERQREKRYASMKEFADALKQYLDDTTITSIPQYPQNQPNEEENFAIAQKFYNEKNFTKAFELYEQLAKQGNAEAQFYLGIMYYKGNGINQDYEKAEYWWEQSAKQGNSNAQFYLTSIQQSPQNQPNEEENFAIAKKFYNEKNFTKAFELYEKLAKQGNAEAQFYLGIMYYKGNGINQDYEKAVYWWEQSAKQGNSDAQFYLISIQQSPQNQPNREENFTIDQKFYNKKIFIKSFKLYEQLAEQGNVDAQFILGFMYYKGQGIKQDYTSAIYWLKKSAKQGNSDAQFYLGIMYSKGKGVEQSYSKAIYWYEQSAKQGNSQSQCNLGNMYAERQGVEQSYAKAIYWYAKSANQGNSQSQCNLGFMHYKGQGVEQNYAKAVYWWKQSAKQGDANAQYNLGVMYEKGRGVKQDYKKAVYWWEQSAKQCNANAQYNLGNMYAEGRGVEQNYEKAIYLYAKSANQGNSRSQCKLGNMYAEGQGIEQDYEKAVYWYEQSAKQCNANAQCKLGNMYAEGQGVEQNYEKAVYWWKQSAKQGDANAQYNLGVMYEKGRGVKQDYKKAVYWWEQSAKQGDANAQYNLGNMYAEGKGVEQNYEIAIYLYAKSANQGNAQSQCKLGNMYAEGQGVEQDYAKAVYWYKKSAEQGNAEARFYLEDANAQYYLGNMYAEGQGVEQDYAKAVYWWEKSANQGNAEAQKKLKELNDRLKEQ